MVVLPEGGEEVGAMSERVAEVDGVDGHRLVLQLAAAVETPAELLVPHEGGEVHVVVVAAHQLATSQHHRTPTRPTPCRPARTPERPGRPRTAPWSSSRSG